MLLLFLFSQLSAAKLKIKPSPGWVNSSSKKDIDEFGRLLADEEVECLNDQKFYPIHWGDSVEEKTTCLQVV